MKQKRSKPLELSGQKFHQLTVLRRSKGGIDSISGWLVKCRCGTEFVTASYALKKGLIQNCGCAPARKKNFHGMSGTPLYNLWSIKVHEGLVCTEWLDFVRFHADVSPSYFEGARFVRLDRTQKYGPDNFNWERKRQDYPVTFNGVTKTLLEWAGETGIEWTELYTRHCKRWSPEKILTHGMLEDRKAQFLSLHA